MLDLRSKGVSDNQIAKYKAYFDSLATINLKDSKAIQTAKDVWADIINDFYNTARLDLPHITKETEELYNMPCMTCSFTGNVYPRALLVDIPNGKGHRYVADMLLNGLSDWEYSTNGTVIRINKLYGDRNILSYTTDPLQYLKFKCLPNEKLTANLINDPCGDDEYSGIAPVFLGIELEVERQNNTPAKIEHMIAADLGMDYMIIKSDSSVPEGFEIVTAPATLGYHLKAWDAFFNNSAKFLRSWDSGKCGMHVHISRKAFTPMHLGKLNTFLNNFENREFITTIAGRNSNYSKYQEDKAFNIKSKLVSHITTLNVEMFAAKDDAAKAKIQANINDAKSKLSQHSDINSFLDDLSGGHQDRNKRHLALNIENKNTVEVRIFRGNVSKVGFLKNLEFVHAAVAFTREATFRTKPLNEAEKAERKLKRKENTDYALHYTFFLDWLEKDTTGNYNNLKNFLRVRKMTDKFIKRKTSDKTPIDKRITDADIDTAA